MRRPRLEDHEAALRELHAAREPLGHMAGVLGVGQSTVFRWLGRLGLAGHYGRAGISGRGREKIAAVFREHNRQRYAEGTEANWRWRAGLWPHARTRAESRLLRLLWLAGVALPGAEIAARLGLAWYGRADCALRKTLRELVRRGHVGVSGRRSLGRRGLTPALYGLPGWPAPVRPKADPMKVQYRPVTREG